MAFRTNKMPILQSKSASGAVASFNTALAMPLVNGEFTIQAYQEGSGDPSPVNVRNIVPFNKVNIFQRGINIWDEVWEQGVLRGSDGAEVPSDVAIRSKNYIPVIPSISYGLSFVGLRIFYFDKDKNYISYQQRVNTFIAPDNCRFIRFCTDGNYGGTYNNNISINYPSSDTSYHAYDINSNEKVVNLGEDTYGAVYNSVTGKKKTNRKAVVIDSNSTLLIAAGNYIKPDACDAYVIIDNIYPSTGYNTQPDDLKCDKLKFITSRGIWSNTGFPNCWQVNSKTIHINIANDLIGVTDYTQETISSVIAKIKAWLVNNPLEFTIPIEETETQLEPTPINTFNGNNTIFADTGNIDLTYKDLDIAKRGNFREVFKLPS